MAYLPSTSQSNPSTVLQKHYYENKIKAENSIYFKFLESHSVSILEKTSFNKRWTALIPDLVLIFTFVIVTLSSTAANYIFIATTIMDHRLFGLLFILILLIEKSLISGFFVIRNECRKKKKIEAISYIKLTQSEVIVSAVFIILGVDSLLIGLHLLKIALQSAYTLNNRNILHSLTIPTPIPFYQLPNSELSIMKIYLLFAAATKSIPQLHIAAILLMTKISDTFTLLGAQLVILTNWMTISLALTMSLPLKRTPTVFKNSNLVPLTSFSKFMAIMSLNAVNIIYFRILFKHLKLYSFLIYILKFGVLYGIILENSSYFWSPKTKKYFVIYGFGLSLLYIIAYIHPVQTKGRLAYYFYYCFKFVSDLAVIYLSSEDYTLLMDYLILLVVSIGFLSLTFGLSVLFEA